MRRAGWLGGAVALGLLLAACGPDRKIVADPTEPPSATVGASPTTPGAPCDLTVGSQLRERTTVASGAVRVTVGTLPCRGVGVWVGRFSLDGDPAEDPRSSFAGTYTGSRPLTLRLPAIGNPCTASAVYFTVDGMASSDTQAQQAAASRARSDLHSWPADLVSAVPGGAILRGRPSVVLAGSVTGDPTACNPGEHVSTPIAAIKDCWLAGTTTPSGTVTPSGPAPPSAMNGGPSEDPRTRFTKVSCTAKHTHEVYWAESLSPQRYAAEEPGAKVAAATWARDRAASVCGTRSRAVVLAKGVDLDEVALEYQWPSTLTYPPSATSSWNRAQVVCLARWKDGKASDHRILG
jgi:hypothetical protein